MEPVNSLNARLEVLPNRLTKPAVTTLASYIQQLDNLNLSNNIVCRRFPDFYCISAEEIRCVFDDI